MGISPPLQHLVRRCASWHEPQAIGTKYQIRERLVACSGVLSGPRAVHPDPLPPHAELSWMQRCRDASHRTEFHVMSWKRGKLAAQTRNKGGLDFQTDDEPSTPCANGPMKKSLTLAKRLFVEAQYILLRERDEVRLE
ncbi:hypothetical protein DL98DRAFT_525457 [Cadophora sp. DSE1049]|nr:hypothetical protein DL98DRAFT_525457 [Cadophora sp. DSE1049]